MSFLSLRNRFLVWPPAISPRNACESATVNSGGWRRVETSIPRSARKAKSSASVFGIRHPVDAVPVTPFTANGAVETRPLRRETMILSMHVAQKCVAVLR
ncbi:hypothetical protein MESS2_1270020 [Mesorhizobium metallidurans STM 2683]|uniref:Uncharacterized protein n=1 Tax=Mesorhizobium metallidurans STM 2683 TaxID=1297569 RepID=M5EJF9_9HYPH|nr:hypothetical protein MESS2_1270020 [Mesorhizobium metallidurans STM 2683]